MPKKTIRKPRGAAASMMGVEAVSTPAQTTLAAIFASIREGHSPRSLDELPAETGATEVLLSELDRLWQNPLPN
jgi:hypothetical protein